MISEKVLACFPLNFQSFFLIISEGAGSIMKTYFHKKKLLEFMKDPIFLQIFLTFASKIRHFENFCCATKKLVGILADDIFLQSEKFQKILSSNMGDIYVFVI